MRILRRLSSVRCWLDVLLLPLAFAGTKSFTLKNVTFMGAQHPALGGSGFGMGSGCPDGCGGGVYSLTVQNLLTFDNANHGFRVTNEVQTWSANSTNSFNNAIDDYDPPSSGNYTNKLSMNPNLGPCKVWIPDGAPIKGQGVAASDIGANILYRYTSNVGDTSSVLTSTPLWNPSTGQFPCGAVIEGVNDSAGDSCIDVHQRLNVNTNGCAFPHGYGLP